MRPWIPAVLALLATAPALAPGFDAPLGVAVEAAGDATRLQAPDGGAAPGALAPGPSLQAGRVTFADRDHRNAVAQQVALAGDGSAGFASWWLNNQRVAKYDPGQGKRWEYAAANTGVTHGVGVSADGRVASATARVTPAGPEQANPAMLALTWLGDLALLEPTPLQRPQEPCCRAFTDVSDAGRVAVATHLGNGMGLPDAGLVVVSDLGAVPVWAFPFTDQTGPNPINARSMEGVDLSADGTTVAVSTYNFVHVFVEPGVVPAATIPNRSQTAARVSSDGRFVAVGGFAGQAHLYERQGEGYAKRWSASVGHPWVTAVDVADDGTVVAGTFEYRGGNAGKVVALRGSDGAALWSCACYGDYVDDVAITPDGARAAAVSWGTLGATGGDALTAFDARTGQVLFRLLDDVDEPGSLHTVALSDDGRTLLAGGKAVHARTFGNGGQVLGIALD